MRGLLGPCVESCRSVVPCRSTAYDEPYVWHCKEPTGVRRNALDAYLVKARAMLKAARFRCNRSNRLLYAELMARTRSREAEDLLGEAERVPRDTKSEAARP